MSQFSSINEMVAVLQAGKPVIMIDDRSRENEGDVVIAAEFATPQAINFMAREARGLICIAMSGKILDRFNLPLMVPPEHNRSGHGTNFTISVEARKGVTTGISAYDRARTVSVLIDPNSCSEDLAMPGHMFPLRAHDGGVLARPGHTEGSVDLVCLAGLTPAAVICEVMADDGRMADRYQIQAFASHHGLKVVAVQDLVNYLKKKQIGDVSSLQKKETGLKEKKNLPIFERVETALLPSHYGYFQVTAYYDQQGREHLALRLGDCAQRAPLVRVHSECVTGDLLGSLRCDCGDQLHAALDKIGKEGCGLLVYLRQEGRGIGLANKIRAYALQDQGMDTVEANLALGFADDLRKYGMAAAILKDQGVSEVRLMTNNPHKVNELTEYGIRVSERVPHQFGLREENAVYLRAKIEKLDHWLNLSNIGKNCT